MERDDIDRRIRNLLRRNRKFRESPDPIRFAELLSALDLLSCDLLPDNLHGPEDGIASGSECDDEAQ